MVKGERCPPNGRWCRQQQLALSLWPRRTWCTPTTPEAWRGSPGSLHHPGSPAIISIRQNQGGEDDKSDFITFGKKEEAKKKKKKEEGEERQEG
uniref:Cadherin C-terminal catenin-binding domain-containing protein n=1 Tax=Lates calcarifer TaxID=8187 RepID=A0A4W6FZG2_LATCA